MSSIPDAGPAHGHFLCLRVEPKEQTRFMEAGARVRRRFALGGRLRPRELLHATLFPLAKADGPEDWIDQRLERVRSACDGFDYRSFEVAFDTVMAFRGGGGNKAIVAVGGASGVRDLMVFQGMLGMVLARHGVVLSSAAFTPHVTLLYSGGWMPAQGIDPVRWTVREFQLIHSHIGRSRYDVIDRWPLRVLPGADSLLPRLAASNGARTLMSLSK